MRALPLALVLVALPAAAEAPTPDVSLRFHAPACDDAWIEQQTTRRMASTCGDGEVLATIFQYEPDRDGPGCDVIASAWCSAGMAPTSTDGEVDFPTLYTDQEYRGWALAITASPVDLSALPLKWNAHWGKKAGSLKVPEGWTVKVCTEPDGQGACDLFTADTPKLDESAVKNDKAVWVQAASSAMAPVTMCPQGFEHDNFGGKALELCDDTDLSTTAFDDKFNSVLVPDGWVLEVCDTREGKGCATLSADAPKLGSTPVKTDRASWVRVVKRP